MSILLDRAGALEMAKKVRGYYDCELPECQQCNEQNAAIANALLDVQARALEWAISQEEYCLGTLSVGKSGYVLVSTLREAAEAAQKDRDSK